MNPTPNCCAVACCAVLRYTLGQTLPSERVRRAVCLFLQDGAPEAATGADPSLLRLLCLKPVPEASCCLAKAGGSSLPIVCTSVPLLAACRFAGCQSWLLLLAWPHLPDILGVTALQHSLPSQGQHSAPAGNSGHNAG